MRPAALILAVLSLVSAAPAAAVSPAFDSREATLARLDAGPARGFAATAAVRGARRALTRSLGARGLLDLDAITQTPRMLARPGGALTGPSASPAVSVALDYVHEHLTSLGLDAGDLATLADRRAYTSTDGVTHVRWMQRYRGIPAFDNALGVDVDRGGRVIDVLGSPRHGLSVASTAPALDAASALAIVRAAVGDAGTAPVSRANHAHLVLFGAGDVRLAWELIDAAAPDAVYDTVVDATTGRILHSQNLVDRDGAVSIFGHYPGAPEPPAGAGHQTTGSIASYLNPAATTLTGPNAHVFADVNGNDSVDAGEEVPPSSGTDWTYGFTDFTPTNTAGACQPADLCSWDHALSGSWSTNRNADAVQLFSFINEYHDHLLAGPIGFNDASGAFDAPDDPLIARADTGADGPDDLPDDNHVNNSMMMTPPDGQSPEMTTELFTARPIGGSPGRYRDVDAATDAAIVFHEYTHGLSNRLITYPGGSGALSEIQSSAMGEGWSDWYAMDELVDLGFDTDTATPGQIDFGEYVDGVPHASRNEPLDCPVGTLAAACPGHGYTYGDIGHIDSACPACGNEPHFDGEVWSETLWDLRTALVAATDPTTGSHLAEQLITGAMRLSPPQPSMLDERNAILAEDGAALGGAYDHLIWTVFAARGMGWFASTVDANDGAPIENFAMPPTGGGPTGEVSGTITDMVSGLGLDGIDVGVGGHDTSLDSAFDASTLATTSDPNGDYDLTDIPAGSYPQLVFHGPDGYDPGVAGPLAISSASPLTQNIVMRRDWAAIDGGAQFTTSDDTQATFGCGAANMVDQSVRGWSTVNNGPSSPATITVALPQTIDVTGFGVNPSPTCGDGAESALGQYQIDTSVDGGATFQRVNLATFGPADNGHLNAITPTGPGSTHRVTDVRLTLKGPQSTAGSGSQFVDATEFEIFGAPPNVLPSGTLSVQPTDAAAAATQVSLQAHFTDPDSKITGYQWDFDGDGSFDQTTVTPTVTHVFPDGGTFTAKVAADDFRGGAGTATAEVRVIPPPSTTTTTVTVPVAVPGPVQTVTTTVTVPAPTPTPAPAKPKLKLSASGSRSIAFTVTFASRGSTRATLTASRTVAHQLHLASPTFTVATLRSSVTSAKPRTLTLKLSSAVLAALRKHHLAALHATLGVTATAADGQIATATRRVTISR